MSKFVLTLIVLGFVFVGIAKSDDIIIEDFEGADYGDWKVTGQAFDTAPAKGTLPSQQHVSGFEGKGLVNTYINRDTSTGTLSSPEFAVTHSYIKFLTSGGAHKDTCIQLLVNNEVVCQASGAEDWRYESRVEQDGWGDELCGCVDFFQLLLDGNENNKKWVMIFIDGSNIIGDFDGSVSYTLEDKPAHTKDRQTSLVIIKHHRENYYATMTFENVPGDRRVQMTWMYKDIPGMPFNQQVTLPSELSLHSTSDGPRLGINRIKELDSLRKKTHKWQGTTQARQQSVVKNKRRTV